MAKQPTTPAEARYASTLEGLKEALRTDIHTRLSTYCRLRGTSYPGMRAWLKEQGISLASIRSDIVDQTEGWGSIPSDAPAFVALSNEARPGGASLPGQAGAESSITFPDGTVVRLCGAGAGEMVQILEVYRMRKESALAAGGGAHV